jgi:hypothetical protein
MISDDEAKPTEIHFICFPEGMQGGNASEMQREI